MGGLLKSRIAARLFYKVMFVGHDYYLDFPLSIMVNFLKPVIQVGKAFSLEQIKDKNHTVSVLIVSASYCSISLLSCRVPNLEFNLFIIMS
jgi:hypothetical protein